MILGINGRTINGGSSNGGSSNGGSSTKNSTKGTYADLLDYFEPRPITCDEEYWATNAIIEELLSASELSNDAETYLHLLSMLIEAYDEQQETIPELRGIELLRTIIEESDLKQRSLLPIFKHESVISEILAGRRHLTVAHIDQLATFFGLPHRLFFEQKDAGTAHHGYSAIVSSFADSDNHDDWKQPATHR